MNNGTVDLDLDFGACSGALIGDLAVPYSPTQPPYTDGTAQLDRLDSSTKLVTWALEATTSAAAGDYLTTLAIRDTS